MSEKLLESDFLTVDLSSIFNKTAKAASAKTNADTDQKSSAAAEPEQQKYINSMTEEDLATLLLKNKVEPENARKILAFGDPFKHAIHALGTKALPERGGNPILAFVIQPWVQDKLISTNLLNINTFKAIYNAVAKRLVADSEFFKLNTYNIIYCPDLYKKSAKEMEGYLKAQSKILKTSAASYDEKVQQTNRKVFLRKIIKNETPGSVLHAELNSLNTVEQLISGGENNTIHRDTQELTNIVKKLPTVSEKFAALLSLSTSTNSTKAKSALNSTRLDVSSQELANAFIKLSNENILPKGQLQTEDADALVDMILDALRGGANT